MYLKKRRKWKGERILTNIFEGNEHVSHKLKIEGRPTELVDLSQHLIIYFKVAQRFGQGIDSPDLDKRSVDKKNELSMST